MESRHLSHLERACALSLLAMTDGDCRYVITRADPYGTSTAYACERARPGESEDELLALVGR